MKFSCIPSKNSLPNMRRHIAGRYSVHGSKDPRFRDCILHSNEYYVASLRSTEVTLAAAVKEHTISRLLAYPVRNVGIEMLRLGASSFSFALLRLSLTSIRRIAIVGTLLALRRLGARCGVTRRRAIGRWHFLLRRLALLGLALTCGLVPAEISMSE